MDTPQNISTEVLEEQIKRLKLGPEPKIHKTHSALQKFINDNKCGIKIIDITIKSNEDTIAMTIAHEVGHFCVNYVNVISNGCLVFMEGDEKKQPIESNFLTQFITDLACVVDLQKPNEPLNSIAFTIDKNFDLKFLEEIRNFLKIRNLKFQEVPLRKVSRDLRDFLIDKNSDAELTSIEIYMNQASILSKIYDLSQSEPLFVTYKDAPNGCLVSSCRGNHTRISPDKFLESWKYVDAFFEDLGIILKNQTKILKNYSFITHKIEIPGVIDRLIELLKKRDRPMKTEKIELSIEKLSDILQFLNDKNEFCTHFISMKAHCDSIAFEELLAIKEKFLQCSQLENLELFFETFGSHEYEKHFGSNFQTRVDNKIWFFRTSSPKRILQFEAKPSGFQMSYTPYNDVPERLINWTLSSDCYLLKMPIVVISKILETFDLEYLLTLRKTCHYFRNLVYSKIPIGKIEEIWISSEQDSISLNIDLGEDNILLEYRSVDNGCMISKDSYHRQRKKVMILGQNYVDICFHDLEIIMSHQKDVFQTMCLDTKSDEIAEKFHSYLKTCKNSIKVENLHLHLSKQSQIVQLLPFFDSKSLQHIGINFKDFPNLPLSNKLSEPLVKSDQWKRAISATIYGFNIWMMKHCMHFNELEAYCDRTVQDVRDIPAFKTKMHESPHLQTMTMYFDTDSLIYRELGYCVTLQNDGKEFVH